MCPTRKIPSFHKVQPSSCLLGPIMCKNVQIMGPAKSIKCSSEGDFKDSITRKCWLSLPSGTAVACQVSSQGAILALSAEHSACSHMVIVFLAERVRAIGASSPTVAFLVDRGDSTSLPSFLVVSLYVGDQVQLSSLEHPCLSGPLPEPILPLLHTLVLLCVVLCYTNVSPLSLLDWCFLITALTNSSFSRNSLLVRLPLMNPPPPPPFLGLLAPR